MDTFFTSWELWQQMTFCLASAIAAVFVMGYIKLCWTNRYLKRQQAIDDERRRHLWRMQKTGIAANAGAEVPFGIRAIQSGVVVEGIWIYGSPATSGACTAAAISAVAVIKEPLRHDAIREEEDGSTQGEGGVRPARWHPSDTGKTSHDNQMAFEKLPLSSSSSSSSSLSRGEAYHDEPGSPEPGSGSGLGSEPEFGTAPANAPANARYAGLRKHRRLPRSWEGRQQTRPHSLVRPALVHVLPVSRPLPRIPEDSDRFLGGNSGIGNGNGNGNGRGLYRKDEDSST